MPGTTHQALMVFTSSLKLLYMTQEASALSEHINQERLGDKAKGLLPQEVMSLCGQLRSHLKIKDSQQVVEMQGHCLLNGPPRRALLIRGLGISDPSGLAQSRILILMEGLENDLPSMELLMQRFQLTEREHVVLQELSKGLTNKEIGNTLGITEQTVKAHVKRLMQKMQATTRTGLLSCILKAARNREMSEPHSPTMA